MYSFEFLSKYIICEQVSRYIADSETTDKSKLTNYSNQACGYAEYGFELLRGYARRYSTTVSSYLPDSETAKHHKRNIDNTAKKREKCSRFIENIIQTKYNPDKPVLYYKAIISTLRTLKLEFSEDPGTLAPLIEQLEAGIDIAFKAFYNVAKTKMHTKVNYFHLRMDEIVGNRLHLLSFFLVLYGATKPTYEQNHLNNDHKRQAATKLFLHLHNGFNLSAGRFDEILTYYLTGFRYHEAAANNGLLATIIQLFEKKAFDGNVCFQYLFTKTTRFSCIASCKIPEIRKQIETLYPKKRVPLTPILSTRSSSHSLIHEAHEMKEEFFTDSFYSKEKDKIIKSTNFYPASFESLCLSDDEVIESEFISPEMQPQKIDALATLTPNIDKKQPETESPIVSHDFSEDCAQPKNEITENEIIKIEPTIISEAMISKVDQKTELLDQLSEDEDQSEDEDTDDIRIPTTNLP